MAVEKTLILIKPDAVRRRLAAEILGRIEARGFSIRAGKLRHREPRARRDALRRAQREAVLRRARDVHHVRPDLGSRRRGRGCDRDDAQDDRRDESRRTPSRGRFAATSRCRCRTTSFTAPTRPSRPSARSRSGSPPMSSAEPDSVAANVAQWTATNAEFTDGAAERQLERTRDVTVGRVRHPRVRGAR